MGVWEGKRAHSTARIASLAFRFTFNPRFLPLSPITVPGPRLGKQLYKLTCPKSVIL